MPGNLLVGQSGGCTAVMNASLAGVLDQAGQQNQVGRVYGMRHGIAGLLDDDVVALDPADSDLRRRLSRMPAAALGSVRHRLTDDEIEQALTSIRRLDVRYLHYIGGNDSAHTSLDLARAAAHAGHELFVVGIPKTVDNDLPAIDHSPGFASAARFLAMAVIDAGHDTRAMQRTDPVKVIEVGGRNAGWLAAAASLGRRDESDAPHLVYLPEQPLDPDGVVRDVERVLRRHGWAIVVVSEGVRTSGGALLEASYDGVYTDRFGHPQLGGAGRTIAGLIARHCNVRAKYDRPGSLQRLLRAYRAPVDVREARRAGRAAVRFAVAGHTGVIAGLQAERSPRYRSWFTPVPLIEIANSEQRLPDAFQMAPDAYPGPALRAYAEPLVGALDHDDAKLLAERTMSLI
ncbi:MAG: diphosphate--fructose-6-phosphate 1-phosphotransferase [Dehalococcoidia bacterium]